MPYCPGCYSTDCRSTHFEEETMKQAVHAGHMAHHTGIHIGGLLGMAAVGVMKGVNALRHAWRCNRCGHRFSEGG